MDAVANTNTNSDSGSDFKTFWKQLHGKELSPKIVFNVQRLLAKRIDCYSVTPKRMEYWDMAIEAGFTFDDLESMKRQHKHVALSPHVLLSNWLRRGCGRMSIGSLYLEFGTIDQFGEEDKRAIRFVLRLAVQHPPESTSGRGIRLTQCFMKMKQLHDIPLVMHHVHLHSCDLVGCDTLMFNISQNSKYVEFRNCKLADGGADLCRWLSPNNSRVTEISFLRNCISCDSLAKLFQSNKRINKLDIMFCRVYDGQHIDQIIKVLSDASHLRELRVYDNWDRSSRQGQTARFDTLVSLLGNNGLSSLTYCDFLDPGMFEVPPETLSAQMEALQQALEETTQLTYLDIYPLPPDEHVHLYNALVERILKRNHCNKVRAVLHSLQTWSRPLALFGKMLTTRSRRWGPMGSTNETFHLLLQCGELLERT